MSLWKRLESRFSRYAIPNLTAIIIAGQVLLFFVYQVRLAGNAQVQVFEKIVFEPGMVLQGEVWRLFTFAFVPFSTDVIGAIFGWLIFYLCGTTLENAWGTVRYNLFLLLGLLANVGAAFIAWSAGYLTDASNGFLYTTVFLAFARLYPEVVFHLLFIFPVKVKWLGLLVWIGLAFAFYDGDWMNRMLIIASVANYLVFFGREHIRDIQRGHRRRSFQAKATRKRGPLHECRICGLNSDDSPKTVFRYCSKCVGQRCYCPEHIHDHDHVVEQIQKPE